MSQDVATRRTPAQEAVIALAAGINAVVVESGYGDNNDEFVFEIMQGITEAETVEDVFAAQETGLISSKDFLDIPLTLDRTGVAWRKSDEKYDSAFPFFCMLTVVDLHDGETKTITAGGSSTVAVIRKLETMGHLDEPRALIFRGKEASGGTVVMVKPYIQPGDAKKKR